MRTTLARRKVDEPREEWVRQLQRAVDELRRRLDGLEKTVSNLAQEIRQINEAEEIGLSPPRGS